MRQAAADVGGGGSGPEEAAVTDTTTRDDEVRRERQLLAAHQDNSPLAVIEFDPQFRVTRWAASAERVFGYRAEEMLGRKIAEMRWVYEDDAESVKRESAALFDGTKVRGTNTNRNYRKDGSVIWCEWYSSAIHDTDGRLLSVLSLVLDVTDRKRAEESERERARLVEAVNAVDLAIHSSLEWDDVVERALSATVEALRADAAIIVAREGRDVVAWAGHGFTPPITGRRFAENHALNQALDAVAEGPLALDDVAGDPRVADTLGPFGEKSVAAAPLVVRDTPVAWLGVTFRRAVHHFTGPEIYAVSRVASALSLAYENARLYAVERELSNRLQEAMLTMPERLDGIEFAHAYHSAAHAARVGGDFYDLFEVGRGIVGVTIGDVAGKGLEAAVLTTLAKNTIRAHATERGKSPKDVLALANDVVLQATPAESFVTVFFGLLDRSQGRLVYASAGHTTGIVARADGTTTPLTATGTILGALPDTAFGEAEVWLSPEDVLFLYTDGLTEARCGKEQYGEGRAFARIAEAPRCPREVVRLIAEDVLAFTGGRLDDDLALLALKRLRDEQETPPAATLEV